MFTFAYSSKISSILIQLPYFYEPAILAANSSFTLSEDTSRHCIQVLRMHAGGQLQLTDGAGNLYTAAIILFFKVLAQRTLKKVIVAGLLPAPLYLQLYIYHFIITHTYSITDQSATYFLACTIVNRVYFFTKKE